jgi:hypothetical protein
MTRDEALRRLHEIVDGIDATEVDRLDDPDREGGWWPTSTGAEFGAGVLRELEALVVELT